MPSDPCEKTPDTQFGRPRRESDAPAGLKDAQHFASGHLGAWREHVAELAQHRIEGTIIEGQMLRVALMPVHVDVSDGGILPCPLEQFQRTVLAGSHVGEAHQPGRGRRRHHLERSERRPRLPSASLELLQRSMQVPLRLECSPTS